MIECPECKGSSSSMFEIDIADYFGCPTCEGLGKVEEGTKSWLQKLIESKND